MTATKFAELVAGFTKKHGCLPPREFVYKTAFQAGQAAGMERAAEIAKETNFHRPDFMFAIRKEIKP